MGAGEARQPEIPPGTDPQTAALMRVQAAAQQQLGIGAGAAPNAAALTQPDGAMHTLLTCEA